VVVPHGYLVQAAQVDSALLTRARQDQRDTIVLALDEDTDRAGFGTAVQAVRAAGLQAAVWIEVGRDPAAAEAHPDWLNTPWHPEWLKAFPAWRTPEGAMPAVMPWISVHTRAVFDYALNRIATLLNRLPGREVLAALFLNDVQGGPSGCGCGNALCRSWDVSPGTKVAPSPFTHTEDYFTVRFVEAVTAAHPDLTIVPVICSECEIGVTIGGLANPDLMTGHCHGITCGNPCGGVYYPGLVRALAGQPLVGLLSFYRLFGRDRALYGDEAAWCAAIFDGYRQQNPTGAVVALVQGWNLPTEFIAAQTEQARRGGASGELIALFPVDQSWWPVAVPTRDLHLEGHLCGRATEQ